MPRKTRKNSGRSEWMKKYNASHPKRKKRVNGDDKGQSSDGGNQSSESSSGGNDVNVLRKRVSHLRQQRHQFFHSFLTSLINDVNSKKNKGRKGLPWRSPARTIEDICMPNTVLLASKLYSTMDSEDSAIANSSSEEEEEDDEMDIEQNSKQNSKQKGKQVEANEEQQENDEDIQKEQEGGISTNHVNKDENVNDMNKQGNKMSSISQEQSEQKELKEEERDKESHKTDSNSSATKPPLNNGTTHTSEELGKTHHNVEQKQITQESMEIDESQ